MADERTSLSDDEILTSGPAGSRSRFAGGDDDSDDTDVDTDDTDPDADSDDPS